MYSRFAERYGFLTIYRGLFKLLATSFTPEWRNWQTRRIQDPVRFIPRVGSSPTSGTVQRVDAGILGSFHRLLVVVASELLLAFPREEQTPL